MKIKNAIIIGLLSASIIGLIAVGIKTGSFNKENLQPKTLSVNAEGELTPISLNWCLNDTITRPNEDSFYNMTTPNFTTGLKGNYYYNSSSTTAITTETIFKNFKFNSNTSTAETLTYATTINGNTRYIQVYNRSLTNNKWTSGPTTNENNAQYNTNNARILRFETEPTGILYTWLTQNAQPYYNNSAVIENTTTPIYQISKGGVYLPNPTYIKSPGQIDIYLYAGITQLWINNTRITDLNSTITITNTDIYISIFGTPDLNTISNHLKITFSNNLPDIEPEPIPDPTKPTYEIIDVRGLMLTILTMPFSFISRAFNVTLWGGTPYQLNLSQFIYAIIGILAILFIVKLFTSGLSILGNYTSKINSKIRKPNKQTPIKEKPIKKE